jgi:hypothetical protein
MHSSSSCPARYILAADSAMTLTLKLFYEKRKFKYRNIKLRSFWNRNVVAGNTTLLNKRFLYVSHASWFTYCCINRHLWRYWAHRIQKLPYYWTFFTYSVLCPEKWVIFYFYLKFLCVHNRIFRGYRCPQPIVSWIYWIEQKFSCAPIHLQHDRKSLTKSHILLQYYLSLITIYILLHPQGTHTRKIVETSYLVIISLSSVRTRRESTRPWKPRNPGKSPGFYEKGPETQYTPEFVRKIMEKLSKEYFNMKTFFTWPWIENSFCLKKNRLNFGGKGAIAMCDVMSFESVEKNATLLTWMCDWWRERERERYHYWFAEFNFHKKLVDQMTIFS